MSDSPKIQSHPSCEPPEAQLWIYTPSTLPIHVFRSITYNDVCPQAYVVAPSRGATLEARNSGIAQTYNQKYLVEDDFKLLNDVLLVPVGPLNHHKDFSIRTHIFLCIIGMILYRYLAWKCKHLRLSLGQLAEELEGIRIALVQEKSGGKVEMVVEEMGVKQARLFSLMDLGKLIEN